MAEYKDKVVIVTGASSGIGEGTAIEYAKQGAKVVLGGRNEENLKKAGQLCEQAGASPDNILLVIGDITKEDDCNRIVDKAVEKFGGVDILINNAGSGLNGNMDKCTVEDMDSMYNLHVRSTFVITKRALPYIEKAKGSVVNVSSIAGIKPLPNLTAYGIAKAAVVHFTQTLAQDVAERGVRVNCVAPGAIDTPIFVRSGSHFADNPEKLPELFVRMAALHPMKRVGVVSEVAGTILYLTSSASAFVTGTVIPVDGGRHGTCSTFNRQ